MPTMLQGLARRNDRARRALRLLRRRETYRSIVLEALWTRRPVPAVTLPPTWALPPSLAEKVSVVWPAESPWLGALHWVETLRQGMATHAPMTRAAIEQPSVNAVVVEVRLGRQSHRIAIDYADTNEPNASLQRHADLTFKLQFRHEGYGTDDVVPGGYIAGQPQLYAYLGRLRQLRDRTAPRYEVYGRFGAHGLAVRERVLRDLADQGKFGFHGSLGTVLYVESLREAARSRVCVDLPGRGWFCYRLVDYLAIGCCIVAVPHENRLHVPLVDGRELVYSAADGSDFVECCAHLLAHADERERLAVRAREHFDRYLHPAQLGGYYLTTIVDRLG